MNISDIKKKERQLGAFYTPKKLVDIVYRLIAKYDIAFDVIADTSAGCGDFIQSKYAKRFICIDINYKSWKICKEKHKNLRQVLQKNTLFDFDREKMHLKANEKLLIVGNPPYNNKHSFFRVGQKGEWKVSLDIKSNDLGISFLRSYAKLKANYVCVLHPLSYLIKRTNFAHLKEFKNQYLLIDALIVSSKEFKDTSMNTNFPIVIALYERQSNVLGKEAMTYEFIKAFQFSIYNSSYKFSIDSFVYIEDLHTKYKDKNLPSKKFFRHFFTLRDMNWLSINKTWLDVETNNSIRVTQKFVYLFEYIHQLKKWFVRHKSKYWFLGSLSPIIFLNLLKKKRIQDQDFSDAFDEILNPDQYIVTSKKKKHILKINDFFIYLDKNEQEFKDEAIVLIENHY